MRGSGLCRIFCARGDQPWAGRAGRNVAVGAAARGLTDQWVALGISLGGGAGGDFAQYGWLGLVSQGGLAITPPPLLRRAFPEANLSLEALLVAMVGVHQLAGPLCFQWA